MESKEYKDTSDTYKRYKAGKKAYAEFFEASYWYETTQIGFCPMWRTIYFWRPLIAFLRMFFMAFPVALVVTLTYAYTAQVAMGIVSLAVIGAALFVISKAAQVAINAIKNRERGEPTQFGMLGEWAQAAHDKVCPMVTFTHDEEGDSNV